MFNRVTLVGNVGNDPELKVVGKNDLHLCNFSVATKESWKDNQGEWQDKTQWHRIKVIGDFAEGISKRVQKGDLVLIDGMVEYSSSGEGDEKKYYTDIKAFKVQRLPKSGGSDSDGGPSANDSSKDVVPNGKQIEVPGDLSEVDDDLPF